MICSVPGNPISDRGVAPLGGHATSPLIGPEKWRNCFLGTGISYYTWNLELSREIVRRTSHGLRSQGRWGIPLPALPQTRATSIMDFKHRMLQMIIWRLSEFGMVQKVVFLLPPFKKRESVAPNVETTRKPVPLGWKQTWPKSVGGAKDTKRIDD